MTKITDDDLRYLIHFFTDKDNVFKTITMVDPCHFDEICNQIASRKGWYWFRYSRSDRSDYLKRRLFVEKELYEGYTQEYGCLKEKVPVYFYLHPNITREKIVELGRRRINYSETETQILLIKLEDLADIRNVTFTLNDSFTAYWKKAVDSGIKCREEEKDRIVLQDHNKVFPFSFIEQYHQKYRSQEMYYEVQIWDYDLLEKLNFTIIGSEET